MVEVCTSQWKMGAGQRADVVFGRVGRDRDVNRHPPHPKFKKSVLGEIWKVIRSQSDSIMNKD